MLHLDNNGRLHLDLRCQNISKNSQRILIDLPLAFVLSNRCVHCGQADDYEQDVKGKICPKCNFRMGWADINGDYHCDNCGYEILRVRENAD